MVRAKRTRSDSGPYDHETVPLKSANRLHVARRSLRELPGTIAKLSERCANLTADLETVTANAHDPITIGSQAARHEDSQEMLATALNSVAETVRQPRREPLGVYRGLRFGLSLHPHHAPELYLEGATTQCETLREHHGPRAVLNALAPLAENYGPSSTSIRQDLAIMEAQLRDYKARLGAPFLHDAYQAKLTALRDRLKAGLSGAAPEPGGEPLPTVTELAERIKTLKGTHTIEATPERKKHRGSAEEPVTARIRRRSPAIAASELEPVPPPAPAGPDTSTSPATGAFLDQNTVLPQAGLLANRPSHQERISTARRPLQPSLF